MLVSHGAVILVIDGAKMSLFRNRGKDFAADLELIEHDTNHAANAAALGTDKPGRSFSPVGRSRSAHQSTNFHQVEEDAFAVAGAEKLNGIARQHDLDFIVIAAPRVLGVIRQHYRAELQKRLVTEINKDYAGRSAEDIAELLRHHEV